MKSPKLMMDSSARLNDAVQRCFRWDDFRKHLSALSEKQKGDLFEELVKAYLQLDPEYATKLRHVWLHRDVPSAVRDKIRLPAADKGIDLIAQTNAGEFWAIQCKYREDACQSLPWREISTFTGLAFGVCRNISFGLICSTTERITSVLKTQDHIGFCALDVWHNLDAGFFTRLRAALRHKPARLAPLTPRPHQVAAIRDAQRHFIKKKEQRGKLIMPCGTGKSLAAYWIAQKLGARQVVIAVPSLALIRQTLKVWLRESMANGQEVEWVCVCSDESAGRIERDDVAVLRQDLGVPCLTDPDDIADWLGKSNGKAARGLTVVFTTYQSGEALATAARRVKAHFDLGIMDEAHKTVGAKDKLFSHLLYDKNLPITRRVFMTATERRYQGESDEILSMDDPNVYGETFHHLSFKRALEYKPPILSDYKIVTIFVSRNDVAQLIRKNVFVRPDKGPWDKEIEAEMLAALVALRKSMQKHPIRHAVSFHSSIRRAEVFKAHNDAFTQTFPKDGPVATFHVSGKTPTGTRARLVKEFAETERGLITNARCLSEGVDVPDIDCVMFADPRRSAIDIVQAVGRALRPARGKKMGYVIVPILHDANAKAEDILNTETFQEILTTLRALAANDDRIVEYFRAISQGTRRSGGGSVEIDIDERLAQKIDLAQFAHDIELKCWSRLAKLSWRPFEEARAFVHQLTLQSRTEWEIECKHRSSGNGRIPFDIPSNPNTAYSSVGWKGYGDWLGTGRIASFDMVYLPFREARSFARTLKLKSATEWNSFARGSLPQVGLRPSNIPATPANTYAEHGWKGYGDWLGTGTTATNRRKYRPFIFARSFVRKLKLKSYKEWLLFNQGRLCRLKRLPNDIPASPGRVYANTGWQGYGDWLGTGATSVKYRKFRSFVKARTFARNLTLKNSAEWFAFCKGHNKRLRRLPKDIPISPAEVYADKGWKGFGDWLGTGTIATRLRKHRAFNAARCYVRNLKLKNQAEWFAFAQGRMPQLGLMPDDIPYNPGRTYAKKGWKGYGDWLGTGSTATFLRLYRSYSQARTFVHKLNLKSQSEWFAFARGRMPKLGKLPSDIPVNVYKAYMGKGWKDWYDWLGTRRTRKTKKSQTQ